jgi:molecular chaperone DnaK
MTREQFESLTRDLLDRTLFTVRKVLKAGDKKWSDLTRLLLVGGSTRMPMVATALEAESGMPADRSISPDESVAHGAAVYAGVLLSVDDQRRDEMSVTNVNSHDLGVLAVEGRTGRPRRKVIIPRNTPLPASGRGTFATRDEGQRSVVVNVVEGGDASGTNSTPIGKCIVKDLPPGLPPRTKVEVRFAYLGNGRLHVKARLPETDTQAQLVVERAAGLSDEEVRQWHDRIAAGTLFEGLEQEDAAAELEEVVELVEEIDDRYGGQYEYEGQAGAEELGEADEPDGPSDDELGEFLKGLK